MSDSSFIESEKMNILFIAPLPPPIHGQSYVSEVLLLELRKNHTVKVVNFTKKRDGGRFYFIKRYFEILKTLISVYSFRKNNDAVYITISQSLLGNLKDLVTYFLLYKSLSVTTIHLHGGAIKEELWRKYPFLLKMNKFFISKMQAAIVSGTSHETIFKGIIPNKKVRIVPNFAPDGMFIEEKSLFTKFDIQVPLKLVYVSGMRHKKGYNDLLQAYKYLPKTFSEKVLIDFAGEFESKEEEQRFRDEISAYRNIRYLGVISDIEKKNLFHQSHIFCLPTKYLEGQPISILEAYASGCCVLTTSLGGIVDIFEDKIHGFQIDADYPKSIANKIDFCVKNPELVKKIACYNFSKAKEMYRKVVFLTLTQNIIVNSKSDI